MEQIRLHCDHCHTNYDCEKTPEIPAHVFVLRCNWCPKCEDEVNEVWEQWWDDNEDGNNGQPVPQPVSDNQLCMPFVLDEIGITRAKQPIENASRQVFSSALPK